MKTIDFEKEVYQTLDNVNENAMSIFKLYSVMNSSFKMRCMRTEILERSRIFEVNLYTNNIRLNNINFYSSEFIKGTYYIPIDFEYEINVGMETSEIVTLLFPINGTELWKLLSYIASKCYEDSDNIGFSLRLVQDDIEDWHDHFDWLNDENNIVKEGWFENLITCGGLPKRKNIN